MGDSIEVDITIQFDGTDLERQLTATESEIMQEHRAKMLSGIRQMWQGWQYKNIPSDRRGRSLEGWTGYEQTTEGIREIIIENDARTYPTKSGRSSNRPYAAYVTRSGATVEEWRVVRQKLLQSFVPALIEDLESEIAQNIDTPGPAKKVRKNKTSDKITLDLEV